MHCPYCRAVNVVTKSFCLGCGKMQPGFADFAECEHHPGEPAVGLCVVCGRPVCNDCAVTQGGKVYCNDVQHRQWATEWVSIHTAQSEFESDMIECNLRAAEIETKLFSFRRHLGTFWLKDAGIVNIQVARQQQEGAVQLLRDLRLVEMEEGE